MRRVLLLLLACAAALGATLTPSFTFAQDLGGDAGMEANPPIRPIERDPPIPDPNIPPDLPFPYFGGLTSSTRPLLPCTGFFNFGGQAVVSDDAINGLPYCTDICYVLEFGNRLVWMLISVMIVVVTPLFFFVGAAMLFLSGANPARRQKAKEIITGAIVGLVVVLCSMFIINQLLYIIFNQAWGEALRERLRDQIRRDPETYISEGQVNDLFDWNNISCNVTAGGVNLRLSPWQNRTTPQEGSGNQR